MVKSRVFYSLLVLISILLSLVAAELAIKFFRNSKQINFYEPVTSTEIKRYEAALIQKAKNEGISSNTFNIYYFGESSMQGTPYLNTIPILVEKMLNSKVRGRRIKWINMGLSGISYNMVSEQIREIVNKKEVFHPDLVIIYSGHNEYLPYHGDYGFSITSSKNQPINWLISKSQIADLVAKKTKLYKLEIDERSYFDQPLFEKQKYEEILANYKKEMEGTIDYLRKNKIPTIVSTVAGNYSDFEPNRSVFEGSSERRTQFKKEMDAGMKNESENRLEEAKKSYEAALEICGTFAQSYYRLGKVNEKLGNNDEAWRDYSLAVDDDKMPVRAQSFQNKVIAEIKTDEVINTVDAVEYLRQHSPNRLIGYNFMSDGHHPNIEGHRLIAELLAKKIVELYPKNTNFNEISALGAEQIFNTNEGLTNMLVGRAEWLYRLATWTYDPSVRLKKAEEYLDRAIGLHPDDAKIYLDKMVVMYLQKNKTEADNYYEKAKELNSKITEEYMKNPWISQIIYRAMAQ